MFTTQTRIGVCGAGAMGAGIAQVASTAGHKVIVLDRDDDALIRGRAAVEKGAGALLKRGKINEEEAQAIAARIQWSLHVEDMAQCGLIIEAIVENMDVKTSLFKALEQVTGDSTVLATNTSSLSVTSLASGLERPAHFLGLHFFNPAPIMKLVEVVSGAETDAGIASDALKLMQNWGKVAVAARDVPGFIVNRVARPYYGEGWRALEDGAADAATLDFVYRDLAGFRMGPFELGDLIGHDINTAAARSIFDAYEGRTRFTPSLAQERLVAAGHLGRKSGRGVYDYREGAERSAPLVSKPATNSNAGEILLGPKAPAMKTMLEKSGFAYEVQQDVPAGFAKIENTMVGFTNGRTARDLAQELKHPVALIDWMREPASTSTLAFSASCDEARQSVMHLAAVCGMKAIELKDRPGLVVFRTLCQLANCAADAIGDQVADADSIDCAMMNGVNYPFGPIQWARGFGFGAVVSALDAIANETGEAMYTPSQTLRALLKSEMRTI
ncbi:MAG: 3-hydroxyacyl-CoA dehydrogenase [Alphaproteobacteria bacterium]|nr:3-hydroxyacyl-CoA dehydrogenase [Alphaproteobacteria bacterium]